jgi:hypothetical protein
MTEKNRVKDSGGGPDDGDHRALAAALGMMTQAANRTPPASPRNDSLRIPRLTASYRRFASRRLMPALQHVITP